MSKGPYPYPDDEFDAAEAQDGPRGVHRAARSAWSRWWPFVVVLVAVPAVTVGLVLWASSWDGDVPGFGNDSPSQSTQASEDASTDPSADQSASDGQTPADEETTQAPPAATEEPPAATPEPVLSTPVEVLNAARVSGLAAKAGKDLEAAGFTAVTAANGTASGTTASTVFYASADLEPTARLVAQTLGITTVTESAARATSGVTVLLLSDFTS